MHQLFNHRTWWPLLLCMQVVWSAPAFGKDSNVSNQYRMVDVEPEQEAIVDTEAEENPGGSILLSSGRVGKVKSVQDQQTLILAAEGLKDGALKRGVKVIVLNHEQTEILAYLEVIQVSSTRGEALAAIQRNGFSDAEQLVDRPITVESNIEEKVLDEYLRSLVFNTVLRPGKRTAYVTGVAAKVVEFDTRLLRKKPFRMDDRFVILDAALTTVVAELRFVGYADKNSSIGQARIQRSLLRTESYKYQGLPVAYYSHIEQPVQGSGLGSEAASPVIISPGGSKRSLLGLRVRSYGSPLKNPNVGLVLGMETYSYGLIDQLVANQTENQVAWRSVGLSIFGPLLTSQPIWNWFGFFYEQAETLPLRFKIKAAPTIGDESLSFIASRTSYGMCLRPSLFIISLVFNLCPLVFRQVQEEMRFSGNLIADPDEYTLTTRGFTGVIGLRYYGYYPFFVSSDISLPIAQSVQMNFSNVEAKGRRQTMSIQAKMGWFERLNLIEEGLSYELAVLGNHYQDRINTLHALSSTGFEYEDSYFGYGFSMSLAYAF